MSRIPHNNIIWDLDGVLITTSLMKACWHIGPGRIVRSLLKGSLSDVESHYFNFLTELVPFLPTTPLIMSIRGNRLPRLMVDYQLGIIDSHDVLQIIHKGLRNKKYTHNKDLYHAMTKLIFDPAVFISCYKPVRSAVDILKKCKKVFNKDGSSKNRLFLITNFDKESFFRIIDHPNFMPFLTLFDGIIVSGILHAIKPQRSIFDELLTKYAIDPTSQPTLYIDDNAQNIEAAQSFFPSLHCFHFTTKNLGDLQATLKQLSML